MLARNPRLTAFYCRPFASGAAPRHAADARGQAGALPPLARSVAAVGRCDGSAAGAPRHRHATPRATLPSSSLGEKIAAAKRCSAALIKVLLFDPDPNVFASLLINQLVREEDLLLLAGLRLRLGRKTPPPGGRSEVVVALRHPPRAGGESVHAALGRRVAIALSVAPRSAHHSRRSGHLDVPPALHRAQRAGPFPARDGTN